METVTMEKKQMKTTIRDVARYAGVSVATVSRYLNHSPLIAEASVEKVKDAIDKLGYQPNMMARGLLNGNSKTIALAVDDSNVETYGNDFFLRIQYGLEHELTRNGYYLMICHIGNGREVETLESIIKEGRIDGLVLLSELAQDPIIQLLNKFDMPYIIAGRSDVPNSVWIDIDNVEAGRCATKRILQTEVEKVGFLTNSFDKMFVKERYTGYLNALKEAGIKEDKNCVADGMYMPEQIQKYVEEHIDRLCEAYVITDSTIAFYFLRSLGKAGINVPEQIQVIGFDDSILAGAAEPAMTVVEIDVMELGTVVGETLIRKIQEVELCPEQKLLPVHVIERGSTR
jgi:DNA-binding LacI/PurR family transcriptional regulator